MMGSTKRTMIPGMPLRAGLVAALGLLVGVAAPARAQLDRAQLRGLCADPVACTDVVLGIEALQAGLGLAAAGGSELPGGNSTIGWRFGAVPRVAVSGRLGLTSGHLPTASGGDEGTWTPSFEAALAVGLFNGFRPLPTIGGLFSVDALLTAGTARPSASNGFEGGVSSFGYGLRLGLLRESFTMPGVTLAATRRHLGDVTWNGPSGSTSGNVALSGPTATSLRATVGKDLLALGLVAGVGWDRVESDGTFLPGVGAGAAGAAPLSFERFRTERRLFFGGATLTLLVLQLHGEAGYAAGFEARPTDAPSGGFDPSAGSLFATISARLLF